MIHHQLSSTINNCYFGGFLDHALMHHHFVLMDCQLFDQSFAINPSHWVLTNYHPRIGCFGTPTTGMEDQGQTDTLMTIANVPRLEVVNIVNFNEAISYTLFFNSMCQISRPRFENLSPT